MLLKNLYNVIGAIPYIIVNAAITYCFVFFIKKHYYKNSKFSYTLIIILRTTGPINNYRLYFLYFIYEIT